MKRPRMTLPHMHSRTGLPALSRSISPEGSRLRRNISACTKVFGKPGVSITARFETGSSILVLLRMSRTLLRSSAGSPASLMASDVISHGLTYSIFCRVTLQSLLRRLKLPDTSPVYHSLTPQESQYYQCVEDNFENLEQVYDDQFAKKYGYFRPYIKQVIYRYLDCGILHNGFARVKCEECGHEFLLAFSCKRRHFCPSCHRKRVVEFGEWLCEEVLKDVPHRHFVFSIPKILRRYFLYSPLKKAMSYYPPEFPGWFQGPKWTRKGPRKDLSAPYAHWGGCLGAPE